jgi:hypothetical protein
VETWNECSAIPSLTSLSIFNLNLHGKQDLLHLNISGKEASYEQYNEKYWKSMNICPTLIKLSLAKC